MLKVRNLLKLLSGGSHEPQSLNSEHTGYPGKHRDLINPSVIYLIHFVHVSIGCSVIKINVETDVEKCSFSAASDIL